MHWSELIGGDVVISPPTKWQRRFNASDVTVANRIETPVESRIVAELLSKFPDFARSYYPDGMTPAEFDSYGPTARTLRQFLEATNLLAAQIRDVMLPDPDKAL
jgi:transaldolase